jgi:hypothetical protein
MLRQIYAVYDNVSNTIASGLIVEKGDAPAIRAFHDALRNPQTQLGQHPADFSLLLLGNLDEDDGDIIPQANGSITVATGNAWLEMQKGLDK